MTTHFFSINFRVYYEDTDSGGVVYYANYLKFAERARTEMFRERHINQTNLLEDYGILFVVRRVNIELLSPARLDDMLTITTNIQKLGASSINMLQTIECAGVKIAELEVMVVCVNRKFKPVRVPGVVRERLQ